MIDLYEIANKRVKVVRWTEGFFTALSDLSDINVKEDKASTRVSREKVYTFDGKVYTRDMHSRVENLKGELLEVRGNWVIVSFGVGGRAYMPRTFIKETNY